MKQTGRTNTRWILGAVAIAALWLAGAVGALAADAEVVNTASLLRNLYDLDRLALEPEGVCALASSYDRYETNGDMGNYLSIDANGTAVLADLKGPGAIVRLQMANPQGQLRIYLDGQAKPVVDVPCMAFFSDGRYAPLRTAGILGSFVSYWPIPYAKSCKVVVEKPSNYFYWQLNYKTYPENTKVETYTNELSAEAQVEWKKAADAWRNPAGFVPEKSGLLGDGQVTTQSTVRVQIAAGENASVFTADGPGCIDALVIRTKAGAADLKRIVLRAYWDGEKSPSVESPLADFFGAGFASLDVASLPVVMKRGDYYLCRFRMPFARSADIRLDNGLAGPLDVVVEVEHRKMKRLAPDALYFHAHWHRELTKSMTPFSMLETTGKGRLVGVSMSMEGDERGSSYLEGDEMLYVDGEKKPSWHGTGTEDFFNGSWYFSGQKASLALYGCTELSQNTAAYRFFLPDDATFRRSLAARLEHGFDLLGYDFCDPAKPKTDKWSYTGAPYACTAYYYQKEPQTAGSFIASASALEYRKGKTEDRGYLPPSPPRKASWIRHWQVIGPFDNPGADLAIEPGPQVKYIFGFSGIDEVYPPEKDGFIPGKVYAGKSRDVGWKAVEAGNDGKVNLAQHLGLVGTSNLGYLYTRIDSPEEMDTEINVAPSDSLKIWINGREIFRVELIRDPNPLYSTWTPIHLKKGENALLLKVTHSLGEFFGCLARIRDPENKLRYDAAPVTVR